MLPMPIRLYARSMPFFHGMEKKFLTCVRITRAKSCTNLCANFAARKLACFMVFAWAGRSTAEVLSGSPENEWRDRLVAARAPAVNRILAAPKEPGRRPARRAPSVAEGFLERPSAARRPRLSAMTGR